MYTLTLTEEEANALFRSFCNRAFILTPVENSIFDKVGALFRTKSTLEKK